VRFPFVPFRSFRIPPHYVHAGRVRLATMLGVQAVLYLGGATGMAYVGGFGAVEHTLQHPSSPWFAVCLAMIPVAFLGYYLGYRPIFRVETETFDIDRPSRLAVVAAGFGGFLDHGGGALDRVALRAAGASEREARVRVTMLAGLEHGVLALPCAVAAAVLVARGAHTPTPGFTVPWLIGPGVGFAVGWWTVRRFGPRFRRGRLGELLEAGHLLLTLVARPRLNAPAIAGMLAFWLADMVALWAAMAAFGFRMDVGATIVAFGTAMIVTRRTGPLGGAGLLDVALPPTLWVCGAHWAPAVLGTFAYRFFTLWLPLPFALLGLPRLRTMIADG
jgi:uncharacterized membrane protein YbhN (UPF0104 family)